MVNALDLIIVRRKLSALCTNPVRMTLTCTVTSRIKIPTPNPTSFRSAVAVLNRALSHTRQILLKQNCLAKTGLAA
jgi:hypothetical protein